MAIRFKDMKEKLEKTPLNEEELRLITEAEEYIDSEIVRQFGSTYGISIDLLIPNFDYSMKTKKTIDLKKARKNLMRKELEKRYKVAGWSIKVNLDDGLDGPNMSGSDSWILDGKI